MFALLNSRLEKFLKIVEWAIFLGLCTASYFVIIGVWEQYQSIDSSFKRSIEPVSDTPTMLMTLSPTKNR